MSLVKKNWSADVMAATGALTPVVAWLEGKGMSKKQIRELAK